MILRLLLNNLISPTKMDEIFSHYIVQTTVVPPPRAGLGAVVKYSPLDQEVLGSSGLSAHLCGGKACLAEIPSQTPPSVGASMHWVRPFLLHYGHC